MRWRSHSLASIALVAIGAFASCGGEANRSARAPATERTVRSNVARSDYAGARACEACHGDLAAVFASSPMANMTRDARSARVRAPFDGATFRFKDDSATMSMRGEERVMTIASRAFGDRTYRITKVIGGRHREDFVGAEMREDGRAGDEEILPVSWMIGRSAFRYKGYSVMSEERPGLRAGPVWKETCVFCHNTVPTLSTLLGVLIGDGAPSYQATTADRFLPKDRRLTYAVSDMRALGRALEEELAVLRHCDRDPAAARACVEEPNDPNTLLSLTLRETRSRFSDKHVVDLGVGCEACHGGARDHARDPRSLPSFEPVSPAVTVTLPRAKTTPKATRAQWINRACARCHQVLFSGYTPTWEGGTRGEDGGGSHINSGEGRDFILGGCASELACSACHEPHGKPDRVRGSAVAMADEAGDALCLSCHASLAPAAARAAHTHHRAGSDGDRCVSCHMPRKNMGLDGKLSRYHRIGSPSDPTRVERDRPLECALCHADKSVRVLVGKLERWWGKRYDRTRLEALYGGLDVDPLRATLARGKPHEQAVALRLLGERKDASALIAVSELLGHRYPLVREYARDALANIVGREPPVDLTRSREEILSSARAWSLEVTKSSAARP